jgi:type IV pilus biogenesis protein CpaD/CtpE
MTRKTSRLPIPMSVLAVVVVATLAGCAAGIAFGTVLGEQVSIGAQAGELAKTIG